MFEQSEEEPESSANPPLEAIRSSWRELNMRTQTNLLATIIKEVASIRMQDRLSSRSWTMQLRGYVRSNDDHGNGRKFFGNF
jgi:hypothetical protein